MIPMIAAMPAGKREKSAQIIMRTDAVIDSGLMVVVPSISVIVAPANPRSIAIREPDIALPNFCAIVPDEKIRPVDDTPFFCVA